MGSSNPDTGAIDQGTSAGEWLVNVDSDVVVPMTTHEVVEALRNERLSEMSLVWRMGMHDWTLLREVPQLRLAASGPRDSEPPRRNTMPGGFAAVKVPATVPSGTVPLGTLSPLATPRPSVAPSSTPRLNPPPKPVREQALAVYERPAASLTFSDSARAEWDGTRLTHQASTPPAAFPSTRPALLTPMPPKAVALSEAPRSAFPNSLMPITTEARPSDTAPPWGDLSVVLASELRAAQRSSRRMALFAAAGSALAAAAFTLWVMHARSGVAVPAQPAEAAATQPVSAPLAVQPAPAVPEPTPSATVPDEPAAAVAVSAPAPVKAAARAAVPRARAKRAKAATKPSAPLASEPVLDSAEASAPSAPAEPAPAAAEPLEVPAPAPPPEPSPAPEAP